MISFQGHSFNHHYLLGLKLAVESGREIEASRVGPVINLGQAFFEIGADDPRMIFLNSRRINPVFAIVEGAWILDGNNKLEPLENEISDFSKYSDDGETLFGAYGHRLRNDFGFDQIEAGIEILRNDPASRRVVLNMFSPSDLGATSKDIPCNTSIFLKVVGGKVDITVINRSNDLFLGIPYNVFVFGLLQRYVAQKLSREIGTQRHFTDCLHLYQRDLERANEVVSENNLDKVDSISARYNWDYSREILLNVAKINNCSYDGIGGELGNFLVRFCRNARKETKKQMVEYDFPDGFFGFLAQQWLGYARQEGASANKHDQNNVNIVTSLSELSSLSASKVTADVSKLSVLLLGKLVRVEIQNKGVDHTQILRYFDNDEAKALTSLVLGAVWASIDPYIVGSQFGQRRVDGIKMAASNLGLSLDDISQFSVNIASLERLIVEICAEV
jgi:thymidylate synthase